MIDANFTCTCVCVSEAMIDLVNWKGQLVLVLVETGRQQETVTFPESTFLGGRRRIFLWEGWKVWACMKSKI